MQTATTLVTCDDAKPSASPSSDFWKNFGFIRDKEAGYLLPSDVIALSAEEQSNREALIGLMKVVELPPMMVISHDASLQSLYRISDPTLIDHLIDGMPVGTRVIKPGEPIVLPRDWQGPHGGASRASELSELTASAIAKIGMPELDPVGSSNPLLPYSLRGESERFKQLAIAATPLLGEVCLRGQVTIWYAAPGTGKTLIALSLIIDAVRERRINAGNVFYVNADDNGQGFATKLQIMDDIEGNTLSPGFKGFKAPDLIALLHKMADQNEARGVLVVIDTIKKFVSLMDKNESSAFAQACRRVAMMGGTVLGLAHTTKNRNSDGTPRYAGTSDLVDDADAAYVLDILGTGRTASEKLVQFRCFKARGDCADAAAYVFTAEKGVSYEDKLASVELIDANEVDEFQLIEAERSDAEVIDALTACIADGINTKMIMVKTAAARTNVSGRAVARVLTNYTGEDPQRHRWRFKRADRGAQLYELIDQPSNAT